MAKITNSLLKQAIADAEAVRETAMANAKLVLEEAITPQVKEMIARRLRVEADMEHAEEELEDTPALPTHKETDEVAKEGEAEKAEPVGSSEMPADSSVIGSSDNKEPSADAFDTSDIGTGPEAVTGSEEDWYEDWDESDFDLGEIIKELESDIAALSGGEEGEEGGEELDLGADAEEPAEAPAEEAPEAEEPAEEEGEELEESKHEEDDEEINLDEILAELEKEDEDEEKEKLEEELARVKSDLAEHREAIKVLSGRLNEVNLLNAKLLFTNKIFRKEGLNNDQKVRIVESFDRATTVREVKLVYAALVENLSTQAKTFNASRKKVVAEGLASKPTPSTAPKSEVIVENTVARRLQELAGII